MSAISAVLPGCTQVADRFHLMQNLLDRMKDIFKSEIPSAIFIQDSTVLDKSLEKECREKIFDESRLDGISYDNSTPIDGSGNEIEFRSKRRNLNSRQYKEQAEGRKKQQLIRDIKVFWAGLPKKKISLICRTFGITKRTALKYVSMTPEEIEELDSPKNYKTKDRAGNNFVNIIYKMMADGYDDEMICQYLRKIGITLSRNSLWDYINAISKENFPDRQRV